MPYDTQNGAQVIQDFFNEATTFPAMGFTLKKSNLITGAADFDIWVYGADPKRLDPTMLYIPYPYTQVAFKLPIPWHTLTTVELWLLKVQLTAMQFIAQLLHCTMGFS